MNIAIDGPAGAGKSATAKGVAEALGYVYYNSGLSYRVITYALCDAGIRDFESASAVDFVRDADIANVGSCVFYNGKDVTALLRSCEIDDLVAIVSQAVHVREKCATMLRVFAKKSAVGIVVEGRDIGTHVLPDADVKIFLTASVDARTRRRVAQCGGDYDTVMRSIVKRDESDATRRVGPLRRAADAVVVDNSEIDLEATVAQIVGIVREKAEQRQLLAKND
jgi:cytidylate kinase